MKIQSFKLNLKEGHAICFDFDGVIHKYSKGWQDGTIYDEYNKQVMDLILLLTLSGFPVFICSTRKPSQIKEWWDKQGFTLKTEIIKDNVDFWNDTKTIGITNRKLPAQVYVDDRAYKYTGQSVKQFFMDFSIATLEDLTLEFFKLTDKHEYLLEKYNRLQDENARLIQKLTESNIKDMNYILRGDNPPLKFEELKEMVGKPVWNNRLKKWGLVRATGTYLFQGMQQCVLIAYIGEYVDWEDGFLIDTGQWCEFDEDQFYRKQVSEG